MALVRSVDALDTYLRWINRKPFLVQCGNTRCELDRAGLSVSRRFQVIEKHFPPPGRILSALAVTMIGWRNKAVHREYSKELKNTYRQILEQQSDEVADRFCGLNTDILLEGYRTNRIPHLKEVTSFISATHEYVQELDGIMLSLLEPEQYLKELVWAGVCENDTDGGRNVRERKRLIHSKWAVNLHRRKQAIKGFLQHKGLTPAMPPSNESYAIFETKLLDELISMTPDEVYHWGAPPESKHDDP